MMFVDVYVGRSDDPMFKWYGGDYNGNIPKRITPVFPNVRRRPEDLHTGSPYSWNNTSWHTACKDFGLELVQLDWGAFGAKISKSQVLDLLERFVPTISDELLSCLQKLEEGVEYALIIAETG